MTLAICDWGIGGLGLFDLLKRARPDLSIVYVSDEGFTPYTMLSKPELEDRVQSLLGTVAHLGVDRCILASDAASTTLDDIPAPQIKTTGVIEPTLRAMRNRRYREIGVIGGRRTILSGKYGRTLRKLHFCVLQRISLDLSQSIEQGDFDPNRMHALLHELLEPVFKADAILLASTHYRLVVPVIQELMPHTDLIDPTQDTFDELMRTLPQAEEKVGEYSFYTTGDEAHFQQRAHEAYGIEIRPGHLDLPASVMAA